MKKMPLAMMSLTFALSIFSAGAFAGDISYEDFLKSCQDPAAYGHQRPPENIRLSCKSVHQGWEPIEAGGTTLSESRLLSTELFSDKYHVVKKTFNLDVPEFNVVCPRFREVTQTAQIEKALTCAQVLSETRSLKEICIDALNEAIAANPDIVEVVPTGKTFNACEGNGQKP